MQSSVLPIVWVCLSAALVVVLGMLGWRLVRAVLGLFRALDALVGTSAILDGVEPTRHLDRSVPAVLADRSEVQKRWVARRGRRSVIQQDRRQERLRRAKMITTLDATQRTWPDG